MPQVFWPDRLPELPFRVTKGSHEGPSGGLQHVREQVGHRGMGIGQQNYAGTALRMPGPSRD